MARSIHRLGLACLGVYLILHGLVLVIGLSFVGLQALLGLLAIFAGVLLLLGR